MASSGKAAGGGAAALDYVAVRLLAALAVVTGTNTLVPFDTLTTADPFAYFAAGTPGQLTVPAGHGGTFLLTAAIEFAAAAAGSRVMKPRVNAANLTPQPSTPTGDAGNTTVLQISRVLPLAAGDIVQIFAYHEFGANLQLNAASPTNPLLSLLRLGA